MVRVTEMPVGALPCPVLHLCNGFIIGFDQCNELNGHTHTPAAQREFLHSCLHDKGFVNTHF